MHVCPREREHKKELVMSKKIKCDVVWYVNESYSSQLEKKEVKFFKIFTLKIFLWFSTENES